MNVKAVAQELAGLSAMKFFPSDPSAQTAILNLVLNMAHSVEQVRWLVARMLSIYDAWPGPREMRACFCGRYPPRDGVNAYSTVFAEALPQDPTAPRRIEAPARLALPMGRIASADQQCEAAVRTAAESLPRMPSPRLADGRNLPENRFSRVLREIVTPPQDRPDNRAATPQIITQADIDKAVVERRAAVKVEP